MWANNPCFVCGQDNPIGLRVAFRMEGDLCVGEITLGSQFSGWRGFVHGGIIYSLLDDAMANGLILQNEAVMTARCSIRYKEPLPVDTAVRLEGQTIARKNRHIRTKGRALRLDTGNLIAEAEGVFMATKSKG